ncbi:MAG: UDP-3-O-(3-hydroxymyristoyl)glucosamine N-acyltransferase [Candidatus Cloacimonetes bacterium]|jgi:UDP-3-O-[3-hydroxymyristoyl] glucosamine N-acyltransferase|nr:UDP-3-O-(3-hydroxymyristoyl)glucosamine N-acyltransferase [Candidatus Cloacimonadota bacterium]
MKRFETSLSTEMIAAIGGGKWHGNKELRLNNVCEIHEANAESIIFCEQEKLIENAAKSPAGLIITTPEFVQNFPERSVLISEKPYLSLMRIITFWLKQDAGKGFTGIDPSAVIHESAEIAEDVSIGAYSVIGAKVKLAKGVRIGVGCTIDKDCVIGENSLLYDNISLYENTQVGANCVIHSGVVLGADGFGFALLEGAQQKIPQVGNVIIHDEVEIGANSCIDRATLGSTIIGEGTKIDNLVQIGHNCIVGKQSIVCAQVGLAGSTVVGDYVYLAGQVGAAGHITIGSKAMVGAQSGISSSVPEGARYFGTPAMDANLSKRIAVAQKYLPEMLKAYRKELKGKSDD